MNYIEDDLKAALSRKPAPPGFAARVFERIESANLSKKTPRSFFQSWALGAFRKEAMIFASAMILILSSAMHFGESQNALANSISRLKVIIDVATRLNRTTSMDCSVLKSEAGGDKSSYRIRWGRSDIARVDRKSNDGIQQTLWISNTTVPPDPVWQPAMEFLTPTILARHVEGSYGLMQAGPRDAAEPAEFLLVGRENQHTIEIAIDQRTYLPTTLRKYLPDSRTGEARSCVLEVRFLWNRPVPEDLLIPQPAAGKH